MKEITAKLTLDTTTGYLYFIDKANSLATGNAHRVLYHRHIMSEAIGRPLTSEEVVHHKDKNKLNNDISNLQILGKSEHARLHAIEEGKEPKQEIVCPICKKPFYGYVSQKYCSIICANKSFVKDSSITKELLDELIPKFSWTALGKMFGYSNNGIKKRAISLGCTIPKKVCGKSLY